MPKPFLNSRLRRTTRMAVMFLALLCASAWADTRLSLEGGAVWTLRNDVRIPNNREADRFPLEDISGQGPAPYLRVSLDRALNDRHGLRVVIAPLRVEGSSRLEQTLRFAGEDFGPGRTRANYQFDTYRLSYRYTLRDNADHSLYVGGTLLVRDAEIRLRQGSADARDTDLGAVPLLHLSGDYRILGDWWLGFDSDALVGPNGRAIDIGTRLEYAVHDELRLFAGMRILDGGADNDSVYTFARFSFFNLGASWQF